MSDPAEAARPVRRRDRRRRSPCCSRAAVATTTTTAASSDDDVVVVVDPANESRERGRARAPVLQRRARRGTSASTPSGSSRTRDRMIELAHYRVGVVRGAGRRDHDHPAAASSTRASTSTPTRWTVPVVAGGEPDLAGVPAARVRRRRQHHGAQHPGRRRPGPALRRLVHGVRHRDVDRRTTSGARAARTTTRSRTTTCASGTSTAPGYSEPYHEGARGSGLPLFAGLIRPERAARPGEITHALAISVPGPAQGVFVQPASSTDGNGRLELAARGCPDPAQARRRAAAADRPADRQADQAHHAAAADGRRDRRLPAHLRRDRRRPGRRADAVRPARRHRRHCSRGNELQGLHLERLRGAAARPAVPATRPTGTSSS